MLLKKCRGTRGAEKRFILSGKESIFSLNLAPRLFLKFISLKIRFRIEGGKSGRGAKELLCTEPEPFLL